MYCKHCGKVMPDDGDFCPYCGKEQKENNKNKSRNWSYQTGSSSYQKTPDNGYVRQYVDVQKPKKKNGCLKIFLITIAVFIGLIVLSSAFLLWLFWDDEEVGELNGGYTNSLNEESSNSTFTSTNLELADVRDFYTTINSDGSDVVTVMVYLLGSDLESDCGYATDDLIEMQNAVFSENVNLIVMTGGTLEWQNDLVSSDTCQYWHVKDDQITCLEDLGQLSMTDPDTLSKFISDSAEIFPANRYQLILWNHGGGTMGGFGYDENYPYDLMYLDDIAEALANGGIYFDFVGFDACLMGTVETAVMLEPYADYMIASAELEAGSGWYYTDWLNELSDNPSISTIDLGVKIIDDYIATAGTGYFQDEATLAIVELPQISYTYDMLCEYFSVATIALQSNSYNTIATARSNTKAYGEGDYEQVDVVDFVYNSDLDGSEEVIEAINNAVKYYSCSSIVKDFYGLAIYFPYYYPSDYTLVQEVLFKLGYTDEYTGFFSAFISSMSGGQSYHRASTGAEEESYLSEDWYDEDLAQTYADLFETTIYDELYITEKNGGFVLQLSDEAWESITYIEMQVLLDDGDGYVDLGSDNVYEFDRDGDLLIEFDYTWVSLDGNIVPFYAETEEVCDDGTWYTYGIVPAILNDDEYIEIVLYWDSDKPLGYVAGYRKYSESIAPTGKGLFTLEPGDTLQWVFDYYDYDVYYIDSYVMGESYTIGNSEIEVSYDYVGDQDALVYFSLTDIYNNIYNSEAIIYTD